MTDLDALEQVARAVGLGPAWDFEWVWGDPDFTEEEARYIAAANPTEILRLIAAVREADALREENKRLRALSVALDDYLWEVSPRDEAGPCRVCGVREGVAHDHSKVCGRLADARAALSATEPAK